MSREVLESDKTTAQSPDAATLSSIVFDALLPFPEAAAAVLALVNKRIGTEVPT